MKLVLQHNFESNIQIDVATFEHVFEHYSIVNPIELDFDKIGRKFAKVVVANGNASSGNAVVVGLDLVDLERVIGES